MQNKKILIITYYWPPSGTISVYRPLKFVKYLKDNYDIIVYVPENAHYPYLDDTNKIDDKNIKIIKGKIIEPFKIFKLISGRKKDTPLNNILHVRDRKKNLIDKFSIWIRSNFFIPDARMLWIKPSFKKLSKLIENENIDAIISTGPPHSTNYIAYKLKKKFNIPWIADFQDPWTQVDYYQLLTLTKPARKKHEKMEQQVLTNADLISTVSPSWKEDLNKIGSKNTKVIYLGYDEDDFHKERPKQYDKFTISHAGLLGYDRKPSVFFKVLNDLCSENKRFNENLNLIFAGSIDIDVLQEIDKNNLKSKTVLPGTISKKQALEITMKSHMLLLPLNKSENAMGRIPGKLFEQMRSYNPILCLGPKGSDVENIITETKTGKSFIYSDYDGIKKYILEVFNNFTNKNSQQNTPNILDYSVENQVNKLSSYLSEML